MTTPWTVRIVRPDSGAAVTGVPVSLLDDAGNPAGYWVSDAQGEVAIPHIDAPRIRLRVGLRSEDPREIDRAALEAGPVSIPAPASLVGTAGGTAPHPVRAERGLATPSTTPRLAAIAPEAAVPSQTVHFTRLIVLTPQPEHMLLESPDGGIVPPPPLPAPHDAEAGVLELRYGALLEIEQYWQTQGYVTGDLLYTISLAPGDEARVAILDGRWGGSANDGDPGPGIPRARPLEQLARLAASPALATALPDRDESLPLEPLVLAPGDTRLDLVAADTSRQLLDRSTQLAAAMRRRPLQVVEVAGPTGLPPGTPVRTVRNPDGHPLAFHYFEPLERWRVGARAARLRPVVLVPFQFPNLATQPQIQRFGRILQRVLLDRTLLPDLEAVAGLGAPAVAAATPSTLPVSELRLAVQVDPTAPPLELRQVWCYLHVDQTRYTVHFFPVEPHVPVEPSRRSFATPRPTRWIGAIRLADFHQHPLRFPGQLALENGSRSTLSFTQLHLEGRVGDTWKRLLSVKDFALAGQTQAQLASLAALAVRSGIDPREGRIVEHLASHLPYYAAAIIAAGDPALRQAAIGKVRDAAGTPLADLIENRIVGFLGNYVACPLRSAASLPPALQAAFSEASWPGARPLEEILTTLPLPGVWLSQQSLAHTSGAEAAGAESPPVSDRRAAQRWRSGTGA